MAPPLSRNRATVLSTVDYGHGELVHRIDAPVAHDCDEGESPIQEIACRLQSFFSAIRGGFSIPSGSRGFPCTMNIVALRSVMGMESTVHAPAKFRRCCLDRRTVASLQQHSAVDMTDISCKKRKGRQSSSELSEMHEQRHCAIEIGPYAFVSAHGRPRSQRGQNDHQDCERRRLNR